MEKQWSFPRGIPDPYIQIRHDRGEEGEERKGEVMELHGGVENGERSMADRTRYIGPGEWAGKKEEVGVEELLAVRAEIKAAEVKKLREEVCLWLRRWDGEPGQVFQQVKAAGSHLDLAVKLQEVEV